VENVKGIDLNPLAVLASKANYIIALADLLRYRPREGIEIPIYLADSIAVGRRSHLLGEEVYLKTVEGEFRIPKEVIERGLLSKILEDIEFCIKNKYSEEEFKRIIQKYEIKEESITLLTELYLKLLSLEKEGKNKIWTRILKNSFAPLLIGKFDYVIGNPPWINWEHLPEFYRNETKQLWDNYGLLERTKGMGLGKVKRDMAMLFVARCLDRFTKDGGKLSFLVPFTVYKTQAGAGFRKFLAKGYWLSEKENSPCKVLKIHDLVTLYPFEGAVNRTSLIVIEKYGKTDFPIPCIMWHNPKAKGIDQEAELEEVKKITKRFNMIFLPVEKDKPESPWMQITEKAYKGIKKVIGSSPWYKAYEGVNTALNQVYWVKIISETPEGLLIMNPPLPGQKKTAKTVKQVVEKDLIYPLVRGRDVKKWYIVGDYGWIIIPHDFRTGKPIQESIMKLNFPKAYNYFNNFKKELENRSLHKLWGKGNPFYSVYDIGNYTFYPYKVVWKEVSARMKAGGFHVAIVEPVTNMQLGFKPIIPDHTIAMVPLTDRDEAFYLASILNSIIIQTTLTYAVVASIEESVFIPKYNPKNVLHMRIMELSKKAHEISKKICEESREDLKEDLRKVEEEINRAVAQLYGISDEELEEIRKCLVILKEGEIYEEKSKEEITLPREEGVKISVEPLLVNENEPRELSIKISNNLSGNLEDGRMKITLKDEVLTDQKVENVEKEKEKTLKFTLPRLKAGQYTLEIVFTFKVNKQTKVVKEERMLFVKPVGKKTAKVSFEGFDELLGG
jgi:methylase of polypeptide subunit release factors